MRLTEAFDPDLIDLESFEVHRTLNQAIWAGDKLKTEIRKRLLQIASEFRDFLGVPVEVEDVIFTGSLANYNYSRYSDIDLHLVFDFKQVGDEDLVRELMTSKKAIWNDTHNIRVKGAEVELFAQDASWPHHATGVYSVTKGDWNVKPSYEKPQVDLKGVKEKAEDLMAQIDDSLDEECDVDCLDAVQDKIKRMRQTGLDKKGGEFSVENLAFKVLRRNGYLEKLWNAKTDELDAEMSMETELVEGCIRALLEANGPVRVFHGTRARHVDQIQKDGLKANSNMGYSSSRWYMLADAFEDAEFHAKGDEPMVVIEFEVPTEKKGRRWMWGGYPFLWKPSDRGWYALRQPLPPEFIKKVYSL